MPVHTHHHYTVLMVVRRFQPEGGMEGYVWQLVHALIECGVRVCVVCESIGGNSPPPCPIVRVKAARRGSGWLRLLLFSRRVAQAVAELPSSSYVIHSHERTSFHQVTTFHGPPFALIHTYPRWRRWSLRVWAYLWMERREVCNSCVLAVLPNSSTIASTLSQYYPCMGGRLRVPVPPGVMPLPTRTDRGVPRDGGVIGFVGKEWRRKGLEMALVVCARLMNQRPKLVLRIYGPDPAEVQHLMSGLDVTVQCMGWRDAKPELHELDLLLHPARSEPYGMVISEAMAAQVPVVVSDACGAAADVSPQNGVVLAVDSPIAAWADACEEMLSLSEAVPAFRRSWDDVAREHMAFYQEVAEHLATGRLDP